jgi:hypothetical protein
MVTSLPRSWPEAGDSDLADLIVKDLRFAGMPHHGGRDRSADEFPTPNVGNRNGKPSIFSGDSAFARRLHCDRQEHHQHRARGRHRQAHERISSCLLSRPNIT